MTISDLDFYLVEIECDGQQVPLRSLLVRLATDSGMEGWGEAQLPWRTSELGPRRDVLEPILTGRSIFDVEELIELDALDSAPLRSALEMASWDLIGRVAGQPLCHLFGGGYRRRIPVAVRLPGASDGQMAQRARELADQGFHSQIITSCGQWQRDLETLQTVREGAGERVEWQFDAAANYDLETARTVCAELEADGLKFILDPLQANDLDQIAALRRQTSVPLAVERAVGSPADVLAVVRSGAAPFVVVDLGLVGGIARARQCAAVARAAGISASLGGAPSAGIGVAAMLQLAASTPAFSSCNECAYHQLQDDLLTEPLELLDGMLTVPQTPGLGVEIDRAKVERHQVV
ncbi:MAG: mandelate racemase/muconate lactonizing enzyme family protein [Planctomycetes bacterium]|nr:mandelate racemase/muconate lactonizing enzyme family protein [Planctomycetota bacterium]